MSLLLKDYSERSFVIYGDDTKVHKDMLKELGGKYNANLSIGKGWIFSKKSQDKVEEWLKTVCDYKKEISNKDRILEKLEKMTEEKIADLLNYINERYE